MSIIAQSTVDIDGVDYWVLKKLPKEFSKIAVIEFNSNFGYQKEISVPLIKKFDALLNVLSRKFFAARMLIVLEKK